MATSAGHFYGYLRYGRTFLLNDSTLTQQCSALTIRQYRGSGRSTAGQPYHRAHSYQSTPSTLQTYVTQPPGFERSTKNMSDDCTRITGSRPINRARVALRYAGDAIVVFFCWLPVTACLCCARYDSHKERRKERAQTETSNKTHELNTHGLVAVPE